MVHSPPDPREPLHPGSRSGSKRRPRRGCNPTNIILAPLPGGPTAISFSGYGIMPHNLTSSVISGSDTGPLYCLGGPHRSLEGGIPRARSPARGPIETTSTALHRRRGGRFCEVHNENAPVMVEHHRGCTLARWAVTRRGLPPVSSSDGSTHRGEDTTAPRILSTPPGRIALHRR